MPSTNYTIAQCACGDVQIELAGEPILGAACYCDDCQEGARQLESLPSASPIMSADGGTDVLLFRKDRMQCSKGSDLLRDYRIKDDSPTRRVVATCCNSAMFLDFKKGHWVSVYRTRFDDDAPPIELRIQTRYRSNKDPVATKLPEYKSYPLRFISKLMAARIGMLIGR
ncbi:GFA family protein [Gilvimarinus sp. F26214L]|uniref:GFA family protein n=1 Tax=Gilvimarinus sp. DZF01 TaxID=3461371 RepID=UPI00404521C6